MRAARDEFASRTPSYRVMLDHSEWQPLVGTWTIDATHPMLPRDAIRGESTFEWLDGDRVVVQRSRYEHPEIPDAIAIFGVIDDELSMHYFDSRAVHRVFTVSFTERTLRYERLVPDFSQRITLTLSSDGDTIVGQGEVSLDGSTWRDDLAITYRRVGERG